ncbi:hypothetical protein Ccrd_025501, partial [Cynara cardunculus var. scolymus]
DIIETDDTDKGIWVLLLAFVKLLQHLSRIGAPKHWQLPHGPVSSVILSCGSRYESVSYFFNLSGGHTFMHCTLPPLLGREEKSLLDFLVTGKAALDLRPTHESHIDKRGLYLDRYTMNQKLEMVGWLVENLRFVSNPLYVSGISYMGIIVPNVALEVYKGKNFYCN